MNEPQKQRGSMPLSVNVVTTVHEKFLGSRFNLIIRNVPIKIMTTDIDHFTSLPFLLSQPKLNVHQPN
jgi:hypothetical protein